MQRPRYFDYLIVGGGIAGVTAAEEIRRADARGTILILSQEKHPLYSRVLLPKYASKKIERHKIFLRSWEQYQTQRIDVAVGVEVLGVNFDTREVVTHHDETIAYGKMLIASGGEPRQWHIQGGDAENIFRMQTIEDADRVRDALPRLAKNPEPYALVEGAGFIGLEFLAIASSYGFNSHLFIKDAQMFGGAFDEQGWEILSGHLEHNRVTIHTGTEIKYIAADPAGLVGHTNTSEEVAGAFVGLGIGIERNYNAFAVRGIDIKNGIRTNQCLETSIPRVWAAGDVAEFHDPVFGEYRVVCNWANAFLQGRVAGANMAARHGERFELNAVSSYSITNFGYHITLVGKTDLTDGVDCIARVWQGARVAYERLFFEGGILKGAALINRFQDKAAITRLIARRANILQYKESLRDPAVDISTFV
jgi:3-phenylpropionate/trans-cinnamate dioxygenase ferredoxin reductase subunit